MAFSGIHSDVSIDISSQLSTSAFQVTQSLATPIEQAQPGLSNEMRDQSDPVTISDQAKELSSQKGTQPSKR